MTDIKEDTGAIAAAAEKEMLKQAGIDLDADNKKDAANKEKEAKRDTLTTVIKPRKFRVTLWLLDENLDPVEELDEISEFNCSYSLNTLPYATITPGVGINATTMEPSKLPKMLDDLAAKKAPVGICIESYDTNAGEDEAGNKNKDNNKAADAADAANNPYAQAESSSANKPYEK